jgi:hypothetical protein
MDDPACAPIIRTSRGAHIVLDRSFLPGPTAVLIPRTDDGRVVFLIPWRGRVLVGTTDTATNVVDDPVATSEDVAFLLSHATRVLARAPSLDDVKSAFAGLRPLLAQGSGGTASSRRDHRVFVEARAGDDRRRQVDDVPRDGGRRRRSRDRQRDSLRRAARRLAIQVAPATRGRAILWSRGDGRRRRGSRRFRARRRARRWRGRRRRVVMDRALFLGARGVRRPARRVAATMASELGRADVGGRPWLSPRARLAGCRRASLHSGSTTPPDSGFSRIM